MIQPPDQWGGNRDPEGERFSSFVVALDLATGRLRWVFQTVHHDLWDYDVPSQPSLVDLEIDGETVPAFVQPRKQGEIYVLERRSGEPMGGQATPMSYADADGRQYLLVVAGGHRSLGTKAGDAVIAYALPES